MKKIVILGSTGQIGSQALEVVASYPKEFKVIGLACGHRTKKFIDQIKKFKPKISVSADKDGNEGIIKAAVHKEVDLVVVAVVGMAGLAPTMAAIKAKKDIALATKEVLVIAGGLIMELIKKHHVKLLPLDSEHSAIFQSLASGKANEIKQIFLTMGKGPIAVMTKKQLQKVTLKDIYNRPAWTMGQKIAVDSATGINKAFEVIEASHLFGLKPEKIKIIVHPEYLCHSLIEFVDGSIITELGLADMRRYLQYALFYPQRKLTKVSSFIDLVGKKITFEESPMDKFPCLSFGHYALEKGGTMSAVLHGADKTAVDAFVNNKAKFTDIPKIIKSTMKAHKVIKNPSLNQLIKAEQWAQNLAKTFIKGGRS